ncbi:MAG: PilW family protein [Rhodoferax sp.]
MNKLLPSATRARLRQTGFSLIELMVAITIALFIAAGLTLLYMNMKMTFNSQDQMAQLQDSERLAVTMLTTTVQSSGYFLNPLVNTRASVLLSTTTQNPDGTLFAAGQGITGTGTAGSATSHTVDVRYQTASGDGLMNCQGGTNTTGAPQIWINSFAVDANNELTCAVNGGNAVVLVSGVAQMTVLYGVDTTGNGDTDSYLDAATITSAGLWGNVHTAQFTLSFLNPLAGQSGAAATLPNPWVQTIRLMNIS